MSDFDDRRLRVVPGDGVVVRATGLVGIAFPASEQHAELTRSFLGALDAASGEDDAGRRAARAVAGILATSPDPPPLGLVGADGDGLAVLLSGDVEFAFRDFSGTDQVLSGRDSAAWLDRLIDQAPSQWSLAHDGAGAADDWSDLRAGVARGNGLATGVEAAAAPPAPPEIAEPDADVASEPESEEDAPPEDPTGLAFEVALPPPPAAPELPPPSPEPAADFVAVSLADPVADDEVREPLPVTGAGQIASAPAPADDEPDAPLVHGVMCSRGHFNDPASPFCASCGISMVQQTHNLVEGPRPPLGVLVLDDGSTYVVDRDVIIGREPAADEHTRGITLPDPERAISRRHARVTLHEWEARIADAGSANGTFVAARNATEWTPVPAEAPVPLTPGMHVLVGQRVLSFDSHRRS